VSGCRGQGLLIGVGLRHPVAKAVVAAAQEHGLVINAPNDETIRLVPALNIGDMEIDEFTELFTASLHTVEHALLLDAPTEVTA
jgi:acetylornithine/N-succinyldiaminopimelate aminotransferase